MTFEAILEQAIAMLQRRRRVAYRILKVQFHLDDALAALKEELYYAQQKVIAHTHHERPIEACHLGAASASHVWWDRQSLTRM